SAVWNCHNCGWTGAIGGDERRSTRPKPSVTRPSRAPGDATEAVFKWFADRGISAETVRRNRIGAERRFFPKLQAEADCIAFPYFRDGELVNIKFRPLAAKTFAQVKDAEQILFGLDDIAGSDAAIVVEGEPDKMALDEAGIRNAGSVPDGAPDEVMTLYREGRRRGASTGFPSLDPFMTIRPGELTVTTGAPNAGKSEFVDALTVNLAVAYGWRFAVCSFENPVPEHASKLAEKLVGAPFWDGPTRRMSEPELLQAMEWN